MSIESDAEEELPLDAILEMVRHHHRREVLRLMTGHERPMSISELAEYLDKHETDQIEIELHHHHIPKLAASGILELDRSSNMVSYTANSRVEAVLQALEDFEED